ncbi:hypothetical protein BN126_3216 [Cronobacter sakazakii 680]|nr:hypothetical protein BN126_3216 [Cronobacter sakazakii 680]
MLTYCLNTPNQSNILLQPFWSYLKPIFINDLNFLLIFLL